MTKLVLLLSGVGQAVQFPFSALWLIRRGSIHRGLFMKKFMTHQELKMILLKDPAFRAAYEAERQNPQSGYQIVRHHGDGTEEVVFDSRVSGTDLPTATG